MQRSYSNTNCNVQSISWYDASASRQSADCVTSYTEIGNELLTMKIVAINTAVFGLEFVDKLLTEQK